MKKALFCVFLLFLVFLWSSTAYAEERVYKLTRDKTDKLVFVGGSACCNCLVESKGNLPSDFPVTDINSVTFYLLTSRSNSFYTTVKKGVTKLKLILGSSQASADTVELQNAVTDPVQHQWYVRFTFDPPASVGPETDWKLVDGDNKWTSAAIAHTSSKPSGGLPGKYITTNCQYARTENAWYSVKFEYMQAGPITTATLSGYITDSVTGIPVKDATVSIQIHGSTAPALTAKTDENGYYIITGLEADKGGEVAVSAGSYTSTGQSMMIQGGPNTYDTYLIPSSEQPVEKPTLYGKVMDKFGNTMSGAMVHIQGLEGQVPMATSDQSGNYEITLDAVPPSDASLFALIDTYGFATSNMIDSIPSGRSELNLTVPTIMGRVVDALENKPVPTATVKIGDKSTTTGSQGYFKFEDFPLASGVVEISASNYHSRKLNHDLYPRPIYLDFKLFPAANKYISVDLQGKHYEIVFETNPDPGDTKKTIVTVRAFNLKVVGNKSEDTEVDLSNVKMKSQRELINVTTIEPQILLTAHIWYFFNYVLDTSQNYSYYDLILEYQGLASNYEMRVDELVLDKKMNPALKGLISDGWKQINYVITICTVATGTATLSSVAKDILGDLIAGFLINKYFEDGVEYKAASLDEAQTALKSAGPNFTSFVQNWSEFSSQPTWDRAKKIRFFSAQGLGYLKDALRPMALPEPFCGVNGFWLHKGNPKTFDISITGNFVKNELNNPYWIPITVPKDTIAVKAWTSKDPVINTRNDSYQTYSLINPLKDKYLWHFSELVAWKKPGTILKEDPCNKNATQNWAGYEYPSARTSSETLYLDLGYVIVGDSLISCLKKSPGGSKIIKYDFLVDETEGLKTAKTPIVNLQNEINSLGLENKLIITKK